MNHGYDERGRSQPHYLDPTAVDGDPGVAASRDASSRMVGMGCLAVLSLAVLVITLLINHFRVK